MSKSALLVENGWTGVNIEPNPDVFPLVDLARHTMNNRQIAVSNGLRPILVPSASSRLFTVSGHKFGSFYVPAGDTNRAVITTSEFSHWDWKYEAAYSVGVWYPKLECRRSVLKYRR